MLMNLALKKLLGFVNTGVYVCVPGGGVHPPRPHLDGPAPPPKHCSDLEPTIKSATEVQTTFPSDSVCQKCQIPSMAQVKDSRCPMSDKRLITLRDA